ncbi:DUF2894 domain-containing protein, partial [Stenotrophomonas sp.]|uniref:DUF2894 domain-containing protein n=1 Tax=Stenotrophomonas sp. TaxID=69392 RepID=UPI002FCB0E80
MPRKPADPRARIAHWRAQQMDRHDPVGLAVLEALQARALQHEGGTRAWLEQRLQARVDAYAAGLPPVAPPPAPAPAPLTALVATLAARPASAAVDVAAFRDLWSSVRSRSQVRQTLAAAPSDGGPLNSAVLV